MFCFYVLMINVLFFYKQKTAYELRISDWSSDVCSSDLDPGADYRVLLDAMRQALGGLRQAMIRLQWSVGKLIEPPRQPDDVAVPLHAADGCGDRKSVG